MLACGLDPNINYRGPFTSNALVYEGPCGAVLASKIQRGLFVLYLLFNHFQVLHALIMGMVVLVVMFEAFLVLGICMWL